MPKTVTLPDETWKLIQQAEPVQDESYTPEGEAMFGAFQELAAALKDAEQSGEAQ